MNALGIIIAANIAATFVIFCGLKLFDIGSDLADLIRRYGVFLGIIFAFAAVFAFLLGDTLEVFDNNYTIWTVVASMVGFAFFGFILNMVKAALLEPKKKEDEEKQKKSRKKEPEHASKLAVAGVSVLDVITGAIAGAVAGFSFTLNTGSGIMVLCALILLQIISKVATIRRYQVANFTRHQNILALTLSLCVSPVVAILLAIWARENYRHVGVFMAMAMGYLIYLCLYHLVIIVKKRQNC